MFIKSKKSCAAIAVAVTLLGGCGYSQTVKDTWKQTRNIWYEYANVPAKVDYSQTGELESSEMALASRMLEIDNRLTELERVMANADKAPTQEWLNNFFQRFPWLSGFAGVRADGQVLGRQPEIPVKSVDYSPLLAIPDEKNKRALRSYVQNTSLGPEVFLAVPLYNGDTFLGLIVSHFDMRSLLKYAIEPEELMIFTPHTVLWPGKYDFSATPAFSQDWEKIIKSESRGICTDAAGSVYWVTRYFANQPIIFAVPVNSSFALGRGEVGSFADQEPPIGVHTEEELMQAKSEKSRHSDSEDVPSERETYASPSPVHSDRNDRIDDSPSPIHPDRVDSSSSDARGEDSGHGDSADTPAEQTGNESVDEEIRMTPAQPSPFGPY